ncbi:MFS transporter [Solirubrobacter phytolaccae]|uniref:MFS transporter n=1 Tax=Solirubrobacter phytolaccae TaxID=1404360 RepID=A0A9X3NHE1_9ACTN|nr:MFS transporter [Solirubrobacter phytolaccae]MDA0184016.1 MFS transporter [Solirubrobacter phytolaccae]
MISRSRIGFFAATASLVAIFAASASAIPLYELYRRADHLSHADLATTAVAYFVAVVVALLVLGRISDHLGRRTVALLALGLAAAGTLVLTDIHSVTPLILGRALQGLGCGLASSAIAAFVIDSAPASAGSLASAVTTASPMTGLTLGALGSGVLAELGPAPRTLVFFLLVGVLVLCAVLIVLSRETVTRAPGLLASMRPQLRIPVAARRLLPAACSIFLATWAFGGFYQAFGPSVTADQLGTTSALIAAAVFASFNAPSALGAAFAGRRAPATVQRMGMAVFVLAVAGVLASLDLGAVVPFLVASAVAGLAMGAAFAGSMRALLATARPAERAGLLSAIYLISYSGAAVPNFIAGQLSEAMSLFHIALGYGVLAALALLITLGATRVPRPATA